MKDILLKDFEIVFNTTEKAQLFFAPGRVNLIGEHTDYNGGYVFPCALTFGTYAAARRIDEPIIRVYSKNFESLGIVEFRLEKLEYEAEHKWANYPKGVIHNFIRKGFIINNGIEVLYDGNIPNGAGLSSSASIEMVTAVLLRNLFDLNIDMVGMARLCQEAENNFIGVNCGIMDQFAIGMGKKDHAVLLDTNTLKYEYVKIALNNASIVIANSNKRRGLADSKYNERRSQCERALKDLQKKLNIRSLGEMNEIQFESNKSLIESEINIKRATHAVYENLRTIKAVEALKVNDFATFGRLMNESHISLRDDYEVTGIELDTLVELAWKQKGVFGSRMTGAGFGGCTVSIVINDDIEEFIKNVGDEYEKRIGYTASFYVAQIGNGAGKL
ncbi:MAG: galactokinase [Clostridiales bacterium]|jgi:galactokinase|nr:galactokinase [Clostridiales bacterium]